MNFLLKLEHIALFAFSIFLFSHTAFEWWWFPLLILSPDISMVGYLGGSRMGAFFYNLFHHQAVAIIVLCIGWQFEIEWIYLAGIILFGHSNMDRVFSYGLKYEDSFSHTHLGMIGK